MVHIAVLMMLKNESKRLHISLNSIKDVADSLVIYDTGSTDNTIEICKNFCDKHKIPFRLKEGVFVNFCESRNVSLDFADTFDDIDYLLLMDCNDELRGGEYLQNVATENLKKDASAFLVTQEWFSGAIDSYFNVRLIKTRKGWRYIGVVHEYIAIIDKDTKEDKSVEPVKITDKIRLYQDRTQDDDKTGKRFHRDKELLLEEYKKNPKEPRTVFYLAQTFSCLNDNENAYYYYKLRLSLIGFWEEVFQAYLRCGDFSEKLNHDWYDSFTWYMKAYEHTERVEPLIKIAEHYNGKKNFILAYTFLDLACKLKYPEHCILFVDKLAYDYKRWHLLGIVAYYIKHFNEGKSACMIAIENGKKLNINTEVDQKNLEFYLKELRPNSNPDVIDPTIIPSNSIMNNNSINSIPNLTKNQFIVKRISELKINYPKATDKQLNQMAKLEWKNK